MLSIIFLFFAPIALIAQLEPLQIFQAIADYLGLDFGSLLLAASGVTVLVNFLKATPPFSSWVQGNVIIFITFILSFVVSAVTYWSNFLLVPFLVSGLLIGVLSVGGWATLKILAHKVGTVPTNKSGGHK